MNIIKENKEISLYVHVPFCKQKCFYCDFPSYAALESLMEDYVEALCTEIEEKASGYLIKSIFIGGGTPSYLETHQIRKVLNCISRLNLMENMEFSMECNPGTLEAEKLIAMFEGGVNRISMGLQAVQDGLLKDIGRIHTFKQFEKNFKLARKIGFKNINIDLMFGLPHQKVSQWRETLETIAKINPEHISAYSLIIEEGTCFYKMWNEDKLILPSEDDEREMYEITKGVLKEYGYNQYEISNYSKEGYECEHNKVYWRCMPYLGVGSSSSSFMDNYRFKNINNIKKYIENISLKSSVEEERRQNSKEDNIEEFMFMGLRLLEGIDKNEFKARFGINITSIYKDIIDKNILCCLMGEKNNKVFLTEKGIELSNKVMSEFILDK
ncbi:radical SAM family heme chaperone HemW [Clostridium gasigenes]|uniref:Heme chaperone HemW n=1 Tax=Clostridium gasigenes TaxID=94869 RepID=A0A7X0VRK1_9CLOT|nr:radical SAM family heme chaperone HemW [Clostridium gasigenes]MBB6714675.1 oxygen-independent coproporphyrinogen III oxidase [Clostridium gasigenes]MBU3135920.1 radical SAM family heme chaperone HemW [Clostridium gasigenes]NKF07000.1 oxygen-independent coproporphyrinogen III oxidase [Clostridium gasigenes]QSW19744.1 oxygen-independent coproporphyrinogen III oxidase [Clostridium gasigenes]